ncbi:hypothetical protein EMIHUDRAFT_451167, partial [Emiliania huxleyi CCMP1516]|uniref:FAD-binding PCMH-type domain-containing protein n=2 Tax=Emiliania huxleyi TaxID=2903 RepID=A0A0D3J7U5_EMIH1
MGLWSVRPHEVYAPRKRHPPTILPAEQKGNIRCADFECVDSLEALTVLMDRAAAAGKGLRVIGSGWSWNPIIEADGRSSNMVFTGPMSTRIAFDVAGLRASVAAGASICDFVFKAEEEGLEVEWPAKGFCFTPSESQTFGGFLATNVHHSHTPTAFDWVEAVEVAVFAGGVAAVVTASREVRPDLFASVFGSVGITGILVGLQLRLRRARRYDVRTDHGRLRPHSLFGSSSVAEVLLQVLEPDTMCQISTSEGEYCVRVVPEAADPAAPASMVLERDGDGKNDGVSSLLVPDYNSLLPCLLCPLCCSCGAATRRACSWFGLATPCCGQEGSYHGDQGHSLARGVVQWLSASLRNDTVLFTAIHSTSLLFTAIHSSSLRNDAVQLERADHACDPQHKLLPGGCIGRRELWSGESVLHFDGGDLSFFVQRADYATFVALVAPLVEQAAR